MAMSESIKVRAQELEDEMAWAVNLVQCLVAASEDDHGRSVPWVHQFERTIDRIQQRVVGLVSTLNGVHDFPRIEQ